MLMEGLNSTDDKCTFGLYGSSSDGLEFCYLTGDSTFDSSEYSYNPVNVDYYKIVVQSNTWNAYCSNNGIIWTSIFSSGTAVSEYFTPAYLGLGIYIVKEI
jgi:hypothetical protein